MPTETSTRRPAIKVAAWMQLAHRDHAGRTEEELDAIAASSPASLWGPRPEPVRCFCGHASCSGIDAD